VDTLLTKKITVIRKPESTKSRSTAGSPELCDCWQGVTIAELGSHAVHEVIEDHKQDVRPRQSRGGICRPDTGTTALCISVETFLAKGLAELFIIIIITLSMAMIPGCSSYQASK
jgi:hypothetical protein